uniref:MSDIN-like toxin proprotein 1 n=1 Tax=Amanita rimosa TaxID=580330 RepID=MSD1_AMARI|nr:RecName: Full=MSDIN-like toxin proprotein 1; Contains: RecName: Full=Toxin MSD1; Flags: Precursor [Amanita rimosa]AHB18715.1 MSDIN-like protein [Amanita rimosa]
MSDINATRLPIIIVLGLIIPLCVSDIEMILTRGER